MKIALIILSVVTVIAIALGVTGIVVAGKALQEVNADGISTPLGALNRGEMVARMADRNRDNRGGMMDSYSRRGPGMQGGWDEDDVRGGMMGRGGMVARGDGLLHDVMVAAFAEKIGLTVEEINTKLEAGETMWTIAEAQGIAAADFPQLITDVHTAALEKAVADGTITQAQADAMKARREARGGFGVGCPGLVEPTEAPAN